MNEINISLEAVELSDLLGKQNEFIDLIRDAFPEVKITARGDQLKLSGSQDTRKVKLVFEQMANMLRSDIPLSVQNIMDILNGETPSDYLLGNGQQHNNPTIVHGRNGKPIKAKTKNQRLLVEKSNKNDIVFAIGPAGTGKTYTAVALAVSALKNRTVKKIILTRPAVEAGESLGFLPGDLKEKVDPFLRPLYDALDDMIQPDKLNKFMDDRTIEIAPLAFMRGRTLNNAFIILDEAQNASTLQLKMFLTRLGPSAKCIITGDLSQIDLPNNATSGLRIGLNILDGIGGIGIVQLTAEDVVRHRLVKEIIKAYDKFDVDRQNRNEQDRANKGRSRRYRRGSTKNYNNQKEEE